MLGRTPDSISVVRPLRDGVITDFHLCEAMLRYFMRKARPQPAGAAAARADRRARLDHAGRKAGRFQ